MIRVYIKSNIHRHTFHWDVVPTFRSKFCMNHGNPSAGKRKRVTHGNLGHENINNMQRAEPKQNRAHKSRHLFLLCLLPLWVGRPTWHEWFIETKLSTHVGTRLICPTGSASAQEFTITQKRAASHTRVGFERAIENRLHTQINLHQLHRPSCKQTERRPICKWCQRKSHSVGQIKIEGCLSSLAV